MHQPQSVVREGLVTGLIGAGAVAVWFLGVDTIAGRPFFTPAVLGSAMFFGLRDPATVTVGFQAVAAYTLAHVVAFLAVGVIVAAVLAEVRKTPHLLWLLAEFFLVFEFGFYGVIAVVLAPVSAELAWINVAVGNLIAAGGMGYYLWRTNPVLRQTLQRHLAGAPADDTEGAREDRGAE
ncbi:MAG: hypothetical protein IIB90_02645 [Gemmatimonadetes bacterium]|nr:hypothetical protein [Gemmatimonadota bacterium]